MKAIAAGVTTALLIGGGIFVYNNQKNGSSTSPVIQEENRTDDGEREEDASKDEIRLEIDWYKIDVQELYDLAETGNLISRDSSETWTIDYFLNEIQLIDNGYSEPYYDSVHPIWSVDSINDISLEVKNVIDAKKEVLELKEFNDKEKEILKECDEMIAYFLSHQEKLDALNDRLKIVANHDGNERAKEAAVEFNQKYEEYKKLLENLR